MDRTPFDLGTIRAGIDDVDRRLVALLAERQRLVEQVVVYKRDNHMGSSTATARTR